jgi:sugar phosphate isomerase/epimerase
MTSSPTPSHGREPLILANGSLPPMPFDERVAAAASAGFDAIGLSVWEYMRLQAEGYVDDDAMRAALDRHGIRLAELEVVIGFAAAGEDLLRQPIPGVDYTDPETEARLFDMATTFGARHLQAVGTFESNRLEEHAVEAFADLCDRAAAHGLLVALEFVPTTNIPDAHAASELVTAAGRRNGGLCVDSWHHFRGRNDEQLLQSIPPEQVFMIQLDDGAAEPVDPDFVTDTMLHRLLPGDGEFDLVGFLSLLWARGIQAPISIEVLSADLASKPAADVASTLATASRSVIDAARQRVDGLTAG